MKKTTRFKLFNFWPPFLGSGIKIKNISADLRRVEVEMRQRFWNTNLNGSHYGGSIFSMTDPFYAVILQEHLGRGFTVWDKAATIRFKKPGIGTIRAVYEIAPERIEEIRAKLQTQDKLDEEFIAVITDKNGDVVAEVQKTVHIQRKERS